MAIKTAQILNDQKIALGKLYTEIVSEKSPKNVCSYKTSTLAKKSGLNKITFLKYLHQLEDMDLIKHKILHIPSKNKNKFWNFTLNVCTSNSDYEDRLKQAEIFLKERYKGKYKPADYDDED